jgi:hypothetical protein
MIIPVVTPDKLVLMIIPVVTPDKLVLMIIPVVTPDELVLMIIPVVTPSNLAQYFSFPRILHAGLFYAKYVVTLLPFCIHNAVICRVKRIFWR